MNDNRKQQDRTEREIIADLERLSQESGFIYTFCSIVFNFLWMSPDELADIDWNRRPNVQELSFLLGLMVKHPLNLTDPPSEQRALEQVNSAMSLLEELHKAHSYSLKSFATETQHDNGNLVAAIGQSYDDWMDSGRGMVEPIFYGGGGADDFQFLEKAERKYRDDRDWLDNHLGTSFETIVETARRLDRLSIARANSITIESTFEAMCLQCMDVFLFDPRDIPGVTDEAIDSFLRAFSLSPGEANQDLDTIGCYNAVQSHPVIRLEDGRFFLPIFFNLARSIYESPYYWMSKDSNYAEIGFKNRGNATEEIAYELLTQVFGESKVYRGVKIRKGKDDVTDIDVLAVEGSKAVIVQAKSKKLTEESRRGEGKKLKSDFQAAVQDPYNQALLSRKAVLEAGYTLTVDGKPMERVIETIDEAYIICLTGDHYPAVTTQLETFLKKKESEPHPIAMSIFDLEIVSFYLRDPFDLLYYLRQRSNHAAHFKSDSEMPLLAFHLGSKLFPSEEDDFTFIGQEYAQLIDAHFQVAKGRWPAANVESRLLHQWSNEGFEKLIHDVKIIDHPELTDVVFLLYDLAGSGADKLIMLIDKVKRATLKDGEFHDAAILLSSGKRGITFVSYPDTPSHSEEELFQRKFRSLAKAQKHKSKTDEWLGLASRSNSPRSFAALWYSKESWQPDSDLDTIAEPLLQPRLFVNLDGRRIGRNALCPCRSGLKFKRCHGKK